jgi:Protein of unknown function (DUF3467)
MTEPKKKEEQKKKDQQRLNIKVSDEVAKGAYANMVFVHNTEAEFVFDFIFTEPQRRQGHVVSRVVGTPRTAKRLLKGLTELVRVYEERFGEIANPEPTPATPPKGTYH